MEKKIPYLEYLNSDSPDYTTLVEGRCPICNRKLVKGTKTTQSPCMIERHLRTTRTFDSKGCTFCLIEFCYDKKQDKWFRPTPRLT